MVWGGMTGRGLTSLHFIPQGQTVTAEYYITKILQEEVMAHQLMRRKQPSTGARETSPIYPKR